MFRAVLEREMNSILIVDDEGLCRELVCDRLRREGYDAIPAADGKEALAAIRARRASAAWARRLNRRPISRSCWVDAER